MSLILKTPEQMHQDALAILWLAARDAARNARWARQQGYFVAANRWHKVMTDTAQMYLTQKTLIAIRRKHNPRYV